MLTAAGHTNGSNPTDTLAAMPLWYSLAWSEAFRRAVSNRLHEEVRLSQFSPWLSEAQVSIGTSHDESVGVSGATPTASSHSPMGTPSSKHFTVPPPSSLVLGPSSKSHPHEHTYHKGVIALAQIGGLVGDGTFASERLTAAEAQYRGVEPIPAYNLALSTAAAARNGRLGSASPSVHAGRGGMRSNSAALNSSYYTRPSTATFAERGQSRMGGERHARSISSTSHTAADEAMSHTIASRRYLHLDGSKRMPIPMPVVVASPSFTADPRDVVTTASALSGRSEHSVQGAPSDALVRSLPHVPIKRTQCASGAREFLLQKAKLIANVIDNGQLYVSPVTGEVDARKKSALSPHFIASSMSPQRRWETRVSQTYVGIQSHNTAPSSSSALVVHGASVTTRSSSHEQASLQGETSQGYAKTQTTVPLTDQEMVLRILAESASQVCKTMAQSTAGMLLVPLRRDIGDVQVSKRPYTVVPANSSNASLRVDADDSSNIASNPTTSAGQPILIQSFTITSASSSDCLVALARKEIVSIDENAAVLQDGAVEHGRKKLAREANSRKLGLVEVTRAAEEYVERLPVLPNTCRMVALRALLGFGSEGVGEEHGFRKELETLVAINHTTEIEQKNSSGLRIDSPLPCSSSFNASSPALSSALAWLWSLFRAVEAVLNKDHMPRSLAANITPGESEIDRREGDAQRTNSVSSAVVESFLALAYDAVIGGVADRRDDLHGTNNSSSSGDAPRDGFGIPTVSSKAGPSSSSLILTAHATAPIPSQVRPFAEPSHGYADKRFLFMNPNRMLLALRVVLGPLLVSGGRGEQEGKEGARASDKYTPVETHSPILESGTEYEHSPEATNGSSDNSTVAQHKRDNDFVLLLLVLLSKISFAEIVATAAAFMQPIWNAMTKPSPTTHHRPHLEYQSTPLSPTGTYEPPFVDLTVIEADKRTKGGPFPPSANRPSTAGANSSGSPSYRPTQQFSPPKRPESASSLSHLLRGGESSVLINTRGHRPAAVVAEEILARRQHEEELSTPVPNRTPGGTPILSMGVTKRDPITRISKDEYNLERVLMSRLSRRLVNAALEGSDMGAGGNNVPAASTLGDRPSTSTSPSSFKAQIWPDQLGPSSLVKHLSDLHVRPLLPHAASPINSSLTASPNRLSLGGSTHNNASPPFVSEVETTAYRTVPSYSDQPLTAGTTHSSPPTTKSDLPVLDSSVSGSSPTKTDSHFVQYLKKGIISGPYRKQLTKANPFVMTTLKRAAEIGARGDGVDDSAHSSATRSSSFTRLQSSKSVSNSHFEQSEAIEKAVFGSGAGETDRAKSPFPADAALKDRSEDAKALKAVFDQDECTTSGGEGGARSGSLTVHTPPRGYMNPTRLRSATRQQHFQRIQEHLLDPLDRAEAANSDATGEVSRYGRPASATAAHAAMTESTAIVRSDSHMRSGSNSRPTSGNFFSRTPAGFGRSYQSFSSKSPPSSSPHLNNYSSFHLAREDAGAGEDGNIVVREASDGSLKRVAVGSNLGETPSEVHIVGGGSRANTPNKSAVGHEESAVAHVGGGNRARDGGVGPKTQLVVLKGPPISAPSIPSPSRKRFGLPVREADRVIAAREAELRGSPPNYTTSAVAFTGPHLRPSSSSSPTAAETKKLWTRSGSLTYSSPSATSPMSESKTKRAHPRVIHDVSAIPLNLADVSRLSITEGEATAKTTVAEASAVNGKAFEGKPTKEASNTRQLRHRAGEVLGHRPISAAHRDESGGTPNGAIVLVPQLAALPVTSGGSFSQRLSKGFLASPMGRQKRF